MTWSQQLTKGSMFSSNPPAWASSRRLRCVGLLSSASTSSASFHVLIMLRSSQVHLVSMHVRASTPQSLRAHAAAARPTSRGAVARPQE